MNKSITLKIHANLNMIYPTLTSDAFNRNRTVMRDEISLGKVMINSSYEQYAMLFIFVVRMDIDYREQIRVNQQNLFPFTSYL